MFKKLKCDWRVGTHKIGLELCGGNFSKSVDISSFITLHVINSFFHEKLIVPHLVNTFPAFMASEGAYLVWKLTIGLCPKPDNITLHIHTLFL
jgi:hypothetical protein